ncbi:MAG: ERAP1-like C-terminal domain-containing protein [Deltaproteobacteria bacterium]|nr:ERAP1-like C-terminal domain-containing protein [Deltaproteobacteria bacterium]
MSHPTADRNYRLPTSVRPLLYAAELSLDLAQRAFEGRETISLRLDEPQDEIVLHAADLEITAASARASGVLRQARVRRAPESETVVLSFDAPLAEGHAELSLTWRGQMSKGLRGLYMAGPLAVTQFEAADARRAFPCFDEPGFKAPWALCIEAPKGMVVLSNGPVQSVEEKGDRQRVTFRETPPLPTYLVALACGPITGSAEARAGAVPVRTWSVPEKARLQGFGQEVALASLPALEQYFAIPYAFGKLDQVGVPDFEAGAMENAGLVTYREAALLLDPATAALAVQKRVAEVVTHELAHMWFGNWVTMQWWDDLWLNESFATWMAYKIVDRWRPGWRVWLDFDAGKAAALQLDALRSTHPIRAEVKNPEDMTESFDLITYEKGGAVLRMIEAYLGEERFRDGIRLYMKRHARQNAVADDLWSALGEASGEPVLELANGWIGQPGFPVVSLALRGRRLSLSQRRFLSEAGGDAPGRWPVPLVLRYRDAGGVREHRLLLRGAGEEVELPGSGEVAWVFGNAGSAGFYRVDHGTAGAAALARHLGDLQPSERIALLADEWALARRGDRAIGPFLDLCAAFGSETDYAVLDELVARLAAVEHRLDGAALEAFRGFVRGLLAPQLRAVGWDPRPGEEDGVRLRRAAVVRALGLVGRDPAVAAEARGRLDRYLAGDGAALEANLHDAAVVLAARGGDATRFDQLQARFRAEADPAYKRRYLAALTAFEEPGLARRAREQALTDAVPLQEAAPYLAGLLANRAGRDDAWAMLRERWEAVVARLGGAPMMLRRVVEALGSLPSRRHLEEVEAFLAAHPVAAARQAAAQTLERMRLDVALWERAAPEVARWLQSR